MAFIFTSCTAHSIVLHLLFPHLASLAGLSLTPWVPCCLISVGKESCRCVNQFGDSLAMRKPIDGCCRCPKTLLHWPRSSLHEECCVIFNWVRYGLGPLVVQLWICEDTKFKDEDQFRPLLAEMHSNWLKRNVKKLMVLHEREENVGILKQISEE